MPQINSPGENLIDEITGGYRACQVLLTANRLGIFPLLGKEEMTLEELVEKLDTDRRGTRILCDALAALSLLEKKNGRYRNSQAALDFLTPASSTPKNAMLLHAAKLYERWGKLYDAVKSGERVPDEAIDSRLLGDERHFALAMADVGRTSAKQLADLLDLSGVNKMLDAGGGPGLYAIEFARRYPEMHAVIFDNEKTLKVAQENVDQAGLSGRVTTQTGDLFDDPFGEGYDFILLSNVIHIYSNENNSKLIAKCSESLVEGGRICIKDFLLDSNRTEPCWSALFAVNMLVNTAEGNCYTLDELRDWLERAGLKPDRAIELTPQSRLIVGLKE